MSVIDVKYISKSYGSFKALNQLSFSVKAGECLGLLGSNGAGKSTTIKTITGQIKPDSGRVEVYGHNSEREPKKVHSVIGYIPDDQTVYEELSVRQNIDVFRQIHELPKDRTVEIINTLNLNEKIDEKVKNLSKGLKQRVLIARALVHNPKVILLDEPTTGLDPSSAESIYEILENLKKSGSTILLTTHLMNDVERLCDRIIFINKGEKIEEGSPFELKSKYKNTSVKVQTVDGVEHDFNLGSDLASRIAEIKEEIFSIKTHEPKLEEIFIKLIRGNSHESE
jgi:ABC-2 type transport system ATP-binding protein